MMWDRGSSPAWIFSFRFEVPVRDPPFGNDTHLPHSGRMHSWPKTLELTINAAKTTKPRIHFLLFTRADVTSSGNLLDALCQEGGPRGRAGEKFHECRGAVAVGGRRRRRRRIACIGLGISRQRPDELRALVAIEPDLRDGAEADFLALAVDDMLHHGRAIRIARFLPLDLRADAEPVEQLFEIEAGRCLVVDDRFGVEQNVLERIGRRHVGLCGAVAYNDPDPDPSDRGVPRSVELSGLRQLLNEGRCRDHHIPGLPTPAPPLDPPGP